jgi:hypothetical protein
MKSSFKLDKKDEEEGTLACSLALMDTRYFLCCLTSQGHTNPFNKLEKSRVLQEVICMFEPSNAAGSCLQRDANQSKTMRAYSHEDFVPPLPGLTAPTKPQTTG